MRSAIGTVAAIVLVTVGCDPCAGAPNCHSFPELSYSGEIIERASGAPVRGVRVMFVRQTGVPLPADTLVATTDASGFFLLRGGAYQNGSVTGDLHIVPPEPHKPYVVEGMRLSTTRTRGNGGQLGRMVVNPYLQLVTLVRNGRGGPPVPGATLVIRQLGTVRVSPESLVRATESNGTVYWNPTVEAFGVLHAEFVITSPNHTGSFRMDRWIPLQYLDEAPRTVDLPIERSLSYRGDVTRRGNGERVPGVSVEFVRRGGIGIQPDSMVLPVEGGQFALVAKPDSGGMVVGDLTIRAPAPFQAERFTNVQLVTADYDTTRYLAYFGYGPGVLFRRQFRYRATGDPVEPGVHARITHAGGLAPVLPAGSTPGADSGLRAVEEDGTVQYTAATADTGEVAFDMELRLNSPHRWELLPRVNARARVDSLPSLTDTVRVGSWFPWTGELRDGTTGAPVAGVSVVFRRAAGAHVAPGVFRSMSGADGTFPVQPVPIDPGFVLGDLIVRGGDTYQDMLIPRIRLYPFQDDTVRSLGVFRLIRR